MATPRGKKPVTSKPVRDAAATRVRLLEAAKTVFSSGGYDGVGVREIAAHAAVDPALVIRYFGSKEALFREVAARAFDVESFLDAGIEELPDRVARFLMGDLDDRAWRSGYDPLRLLLCSIGSETAGPILSEYLQACFLQPLAAALPGRLAAERAAMLGANIIGIALIRIVSATAAKPLRRAELTQMLAQALRSCVATPKVAR